MGTWFSRLRSGPCAEPAGGVIGRPRRPDGLRRARSAHRACALLAAAGLIAALGVDRVAARKRLAVGRAAT